MTPTKPIPRAPRGPWAEDALIRESAFRILERPRVGEPTWERNGHTYTHAEALAIAQRELGKRQAAAAVL